MLDPSKDNNFGDTLFCTIIFSGRSVFMPFIPIFILIIVKLN